MIRVPAFIARPAAFSNTAENVWPGSVRAPSDMDTTRHLFLTAHWMPLSSRISPASLIAQDLAGKDPRAVRDAVPRQRSRMKRAERSADAEGSMPVTVLNRLTSDKGLALDRSARKIGMLEIHAGVEHRDPNTLPRARGSSTSRTRRSRRGDRPRLACAGRLTRRSPP